MSFKITFKTPDAIDNAIQEEILCKTYQMLGDETESLTEEQGEEIFEFGQKLRALVGKFTRDSEYITVEFDVEAGTCNVCKKV